MPDSIMDLGKRLEAEIKEFDRKRDHRIKIVSWGLALAFCAIFWAAVWRAIQ